MKFITHLSKAASSRACFIGSILAGVPVIVNAQAVDSATSSRASIVSISPIELIYKIQVGYERRWRSRNSLGLLGSYHYGSFARTDQLRGGQLTGYYRRFLTHEFPTGLYIQVQASILDFMHHANLATIKTNEPYKFDYIAVSGGAGFGFGYRGRLLQRVAGGRLLYNTLLGVRFQNRPRTDYDMSIYRPQTGLVFGETDDTNWNLGFGPGSLVHGLLTLDYQF